MRTTIFIGEFAVLLGAVISASATHAQNYPTKAIRVVVPYPAGGPADIISRTIGQKFAESVSQPVIIDNRAGAGGSVGTELVARSQPDGYTMVWGTGGTHGINPSLYPRLPYDAVKDFAPITLVALGTNVLVVHPSVPATSVKELIALAKSRPGQLNFASASSGATSHLAGELFKLVAGVDMVHVPFKGAAPAIVTLVGGQVDLAILDMPALLPHIRSGRLRALGVASAKRSNVLPELPTLIESGLPGMVASSWHGLFAPAATPRDIVMKINGEIARIVRQADVIERLSGLGAEPVGNTPEECAAFVRSEIARWAKVVKASGAKVD